MLTGLLNSIPGYVIRGENCNFVYPLFQSYSRILNSKSKHGGSQGRSVTDPWWGVNEICVDTYLCDTRKLVDNVLIGALESKPRVFGFKEIRYPWMAQKGQLPEYLNYIMMTCVP